MAAIELKHVYKYYEDGVAAVQDFNLEIKKQEFVVFVGPSGCGKSTTLRMIAGLEEISDGKLLMNGKLVNHVKANKRDVAMVFQNYALYPHMSVYDNIAYSLKLNHQSRSQIREEVMRVAQSLDSVQILERKPGELSGGQKQRVAIGRAMVRKPKVFLMDEPLSNLDAKLRGKMRAEISELYRMLQTTFIYVTHDQIEAMTLGTKIVVMKEGIVQQIATPKELYQHPANVFVAQFIGTPQMNLFCGKICFRENRYLLVIDDYEIPLYEEQGQYFYNKFYIGEEVLVGVRPEDVQVNRATEKGLALPLAAYELLGGEKNYFFQYGNERIAAVVKNEEIPETGAVYRLQFLPQKLHFLTKKRRSESDKISKKVSYNKKLY